MVEWNKRCSPPFPCFTVNRQCLWKKTLIEKKVNEKNTELSPFVFCFLFSIWVFFHEHLRITGLQGKAEGISLTPHYHFHPLHRHLDSSRTRTGNLTYSEYKTINNSNSNQLSEKCFWTKWAFEVRKKTKTELNIVSTLSEVYVF